MDGGEPLEPVNVVGVFDGNVAKRKEGSSQVMVVSTQPIVVGNSPNEEKASDYVRVAFIGQVLGHAWDGSGYGGENRMLAPPE